LLVIKALQDRESKFRDNDEKIEKIFEEGVTQVKGKSRKELAEITEQIITFTAKFTIPCLSLESIVQMDESCNALLTTLEAKRTTIKNQIDSLDKVGDLLESTLKDYSEKD